MGRFHEMGFKGLLRHPSPPYPKAGSFFGQSPGRGIDHGSQSISLPISWRNWAGKAVTTMPLPSSHQEARPPDQADGQKMIIGLMAISRQRSRKEAKQGQAAGMSCPPRLFFEPFQ